MIRLDGMSSYYEETAQYYLM